MRVLKNGNQMRNREQLLLFDACSAESCVGMPLLSGAKVRVGLCQLGVWREILRTVNHCTAQSTRLYEFCQV